MTAEGPKGDRTRGLILRQAVGLAYRVGLEGLTIGALAADVEMSKSGMYAHFGSKQALQLAVLDVAAEDFARAVVVPALREPRGEPRVRALVAAWMECGTARRPGGCLFVKASTELDERPGPVRDRLVELHAQLDDSLARVFRSGVEDGQFRPDADPAQFAADLYSVMLGFYHRHRLLADPRAAERATHAVDALLAAARRTGAAPSGTAPSGTAPSGTASSGTASSGTAPSGTASSGTAQSDPTEVTA